MRETQRVAARARVPRRYHRASTHEQLERARNVALWLPAAGGIERGVGGAPETAAARGARAQGEPAGYRVHGLAEVGRHLRRRLEELLERYAGRLWSDPLVAPAARGRTRAELEDHALSFLGDLAQSRVVADDAGELTAELLKDGGAIQRTIAELHGRQRFALGWTESQLAREFEILREETAGVVRDRVPDGAGDVSAALDVIARLLTRSADASHRAFRRASLAAARSGSV